MTWSGITLDSNANEYLAIEIGVGPSSSKFLITQSSNTNPSLSNIPYQSHVEDVPDLEAEPVKRQLPHHITRGIPKPTSELDLSSKVKYFMSHYVSNHRLSESNLSFVNQLSTVSIPNSVQEELIDHRWKEAVNEEMKSL